MARSGAVTVNGIRLHVEEGGPVGAPPVLLIMGLGAPHVGYALQLPAFRARYRAIAFDNRGVGRSATPAGRFSTRDMADDAAGVLDALEVERAHVVGVSLGGMVAQELAIALPDRVGALVLASTYARPPREVRALAERARERWGDPLGAVKWIVDLTLTREFQRREGARIAALFAEASPHGPSLEGLLAQGEASLRHDASARLSRVRAPTLVLTGDADRFIPHEASDEIAARVPGARLERIPGGSHGANFEQAEAWNAAVLGFLAAHDGLLGGGRAPAAAAASGGGAARRVL
jgi:pimeloyl-ACP methyl ester carboxylesterase